MSTTPKEHEKPLTIREKIAIKILMLIVEMLKPQEYHYQFKDVYDDITGDLKTIKPKA